MEVLVYLKGQYHTELVELFSDLIRICCWLQLQISVIISLCISLPHDVQEIVGLQRRLGKGEV